MRIGLSLGIRSGVSAVNNNAINTRHTYIAEIKYTGPSIVIGQENKI
jgi:hypothetical protein